MRRGERFYVWLVDHLVPRLAEDDRELLLESWRWMAVRAGRRPVHRAWFWVRMLADLGVVVARERWEKGTGGGWRMMQDLMQGWRALRRSPRATVTAVLTLALGIGGTTAMFSIVNGVLLSPLPYPDPDRMVAIWERSDDGADLTTSYLNFRDWRSASSTIPTMAGFTSARPMTLLTGSGGVRAQVSTVTADFFRVVGTQPLIGRTFGPDENRPGGPAVAVIGEAFWRGELGSPPTLDGVTLNIDGESHAVVGVVPARVRLPEGSDVWLPLERAVPWTVRGNHVIRVVGRMAEGVEVGAADRELDGIHGRLNGEHADVESPGARVRTLEDEVLGGSRRALITLLLASGLLTLVACTNVASTLLARGLGRRREFAVRASLGADRGRLVRQLLSESAILGLLGAMVGLGVARGLVWLARTTDAGSVPRLDEVGLDGNVLIFAAGFGLAASLLFGLIPSLRLTVGGTSGALRSRPGGGADRDVRRSWRVLAGAEVALASVLLVGAGLTARSLAEILHRDNGFRSAGVVTGTLHFPLSEYDVDSGLAYIDAMVERLVSHASIDAAGTVLMLPVAGTGGIAGPVIPDGAERTDEIFSYQVAHPGYFDVLEIPLLRGRMFGPDDDDAAPHVAIVDEAMAERLWPGEDPLGKRFGVGGMDPYRDHDLTVVGVVPEVRHWQQERGDNPTYYVSYRQRPAFYGFFGAQIAVSGRSSGQVADLLRSTATELDPDVPVRIRTLDSMVAGSASTQRFAGTVLAAFAGLSLLLAAIGLYSVIAYTVTRRTREVGIRLALGAEASSISGQILREAMGTAALGVGAGLVAAALLGRLVEPLLFSVTALDPLTYGSAALALMAVSFFAGWWPARRALRIDPADTLNSE